MFRNYLKTAWRNLVRNKAFSFINIFGLALGLACSLMIFLWIRDEKSVDSFHTNAKQLFQVYERSSYDGKVTASYPTQGLLAEELKRTVPGIQYASGFEYAAAPEASNTFRVGDKIAKRNGMFAGGDFFSMFSFPLIEGNAKTAILNPSSIAISKSMADVFFESPAQAVGKIIRFDDKEDLQVTAVFADIPANSSLQFDFLRSWTDFVKQNDWVHNWGNTSPQTFIQLSREASPEKVEAAIKDFIYRYKPKADGMKTALALQPFADRYLHSSFKDGYIDGGRIEYVHLFSIIAVFVLLIACINFMNLVTAGSVHRAREVGVRKVIGAVRASLIVQFIGEAILATLLAIGIALVFVGFSLPAFNQLTGKQLQLAINDPFFWLTAGGLLLLTALIAGSYPAFFMSSLKPVHVLKGDLKFSWSNRLFRKGLVVFQFTLSIVLITATIVIYRQMNYVQHKNLGYNRDNLLYLPLEGGLIGKYNVFKDEALAHTDIVDVSKMRNSPTVIEHHTGSISWPGKPPNLVVDFADGVVGYDFVKTMQLQMASGRDFDRAYADTASYLLNETAVNKIGLKDPVGKRISWGNHEGTIIGVIKDFHFNSLHETIEPLIVRLDEHWSWGTILVRIKAGKTQEAIASLQKICKELNPDFPFTYQFSDLEYARLYRSEQVVSKLSNGFAFLAIFISGLGLLGLAMFTVGQRSKEMGVRKVLGASSRNIIALLSVNFLKPVAVAFVIAFPLAWYATDKWLDSFQYRITISWWMFAAAGLIAVIVALFAISFQSIRAAMANPVKSLRSE